MVAEASKVEQLELRRQQENPLISKFKEELEIIKFPSKRERGHSWVQFQR